MNLTADWALTGIYAANTIWHRMSPFGAAAAMSELQAQAEAARMVGEKLAAGFEGGMNAMASSLRIASAAARGKVTADDMSRAAATILYAGLRPAMVRARSNSRRLQRQAEKSKR